MNILEKKDSDTIFFLLKQLWLVFKGKVDGN